MYLSVFRLGGVVKYIVLSLFCVILMSPRVVCEHRPDNLEDMEPMVWYDLKQPAPYFQKIIPDPTTPGRLFALTGELGSYFGDLYKSSDNGATWQLVIAGGSQYRFKPFFLNGQVGIVRCSWPIDKTELSFDFGQTWAIHATPLHFTDIEVSSFNGSIVAYYLDDLNNIYSFWKSSDYGMTWAKTLERNRVKTNTYPMLDYSPFISGIIVASDGLAEGEYGTTIFLSRDDGATWDKLPTDNLWSIKWVSFHPTNSNEFYLMFNKDQWWQYPVRRTRDGGQTWEEFGPDCSERKMMGEYLFADPDNSDVYMLSNHYRSGLFNTDPGGIYMTLDGGVTWETVLYDSAKQGSYTFSNPSQAWKSTTGSGEIFVLLEQLFKLPASGENWVPVYPLAHDFIEPHGGYIGNNQELILYAQQYCGMFFSHDGGITWSPSEVPINSFEAFYVRDFSVDAVDSDIIYFSVPERREEPHIHFCSTNRGKSWQRIEYTGPGSLDQVKASSIVPNRVFGFYTTENDECKVAMSDDNGRTWTPIKTPHPAGLGSFIDSRWDENIWYCTECVETEGSDTIELWLSFSSDFGENWQRKAMIHRKSEHCNNYILPKLTLYEDPINPERLYLSQSSVGLFRSENSGESWYCLNDRIKGSTFFDIQCYSEDIILWGNERSFDDGRIWCDWEEQIAPWFYPPGHWLDKENYYLLFSNRNSKVMKVEKNEPIINMAGFGSTWIVQGTPGNLDILIWATDPGQNDRVTSIEVFWEGDPVGFKIEQELVDESGLFWIQLPYDQLNDDLNELQFRAKDIWGHLSAPSKFTKLF